MSATDVTALRRALWAWIKSATALADDHIIWAEQVEKKLVIPPQDGTLWISLRIRSLDGFGRDWTTTEKNAAAWRTITVDSVTDEVALTAHGYAQGAGAFRFSNTGGALPGNVSAATPYWLDVVDPDHFKIATSQANALAHVDVDITSDGTGTQQVVLVGTEVSHKVQGPRQASLELRAFGGDLGEAVSALNDVRAAYKLPDVAADLREADLGIGRFSPITSQDGYVGAARVFEPRQMMDVVVFTKSELVATTTYIERAEVTNQISGDVVEIDAPEP